MTGKEKYQRCKDLLPESYEIGTWVSVSGQFQMSMDLDCVIRVRTPISGMWSIESVTTNGKCKSYYEPMHALEAAIYL